jgi:hypothetical protein
MGPLEVTPYEPPPPNPFADLSDEQVEAMLSGQAPEAPQEPEPAPAPEAVPVEESAPAVPEVPDEPTAAEETASASVDDRLAELERTLELERLERQKATAELERTKFLASRNAGEAGYLKKLLADRQRTEAEGGYADSPQDAGDHPGMDEIRKELGALKSERVAQALAEVGAAFERAHPDAKDYATEMQAILQQTSEEDVQAALYSDDPKLARITAKSILESAYAEARIKALQKQREEAKSRSVVQADKLRGRKVEAAPPGTQRAPAPERSSAPKTIEQMTDAELDALLDSRIRRGG